MTSRQETSEAIMSSLCCKSMWLFSTTPSLSHYLIQHLAFKISKTMTNTYHMLPEPKVMPEVQPTEN